MTPPSPAGPPPETSPAPQAAVTSPRLDTSSIDLEQLRQVLSLRDPELLKHVETYIRLKTMLDRQARIIENALTGQQQQPQLHQSRFSVLDTASSTPTALSVRPSGDPSGGMVLVEGPPPMPLGDIMHHPQPIGGGPPGLMGMNGGMSGGMEPLDLEALLNNREEETRTTLMMKKIPKYFTVFHLQQALDACCPYVNDEPCYDLLYLPADVHGVANRGFAFVNLRSPQHLVVFAAHVANLTFPAGRAGGGKAGGASGFKRCEVYFARIQGREATLANLEQSSNSSGHTNSSAGFRAMLESLGTKPLIIGFGAAPMRRSKERQRHPSMGMDPPMGITAGGGGGPGSGVCSTCFYERDPSRGLECACNMPQADHGFTDEEEPSSHFHSSMDNIDENGPPATDTSSSDTNDQLPECAQQ